MKILIKGAGDLATGIASRLYGAGHRIMMTEIKVPLTVRRTVALSRAVYEQRAKVEEMEAFRADTKEEAEKILSRGDIPVLVDPTADCKRWFQPDVIVDSILAKKNLGTAITDAPFVVGVGPGFTAGEDCNCVIETKRGHTLGNVIWKGSAIPNTGVPGNIGGYTIERLIRSTGEGVIEPKVAIGDLVEKGQLVALTGGIPVYAQMSGIVRGMLQPGVFVKKGLKCGDIDARAESSHCETISDKAKAIGGGVLEAVQRFERMKGHYAIVLLAAGEGKRFRGKKLQEHFHGKPLYMHMLEKARSFSSFPICVVTGDEAIMQSAKNFGMAVSINENPEKGISYSLQLGLEKVMELMKDQGGFPNQSLKGVLFSVCDQPQISNVTLQKIFNDAVLHPGSIVCAGHNGKRGNPVLWDQIYLEELRHLTGDVGGKQILQQYEPCIRVVEAEEKELIDIDSREDLESLRKEG